MYAIRCVKERVDRSCVRGGSRKRKKERKRKRLLIDGDRDLERERERNCTDARGNSPSDIDRT